MRNEAKTRKELIDPALTKAGWNLKDKSQVDVEIPVDGYDKEPWNGVTDYCLFRPNNDVIAVVEAKRTSRDPRVGLEQVRHYVTEIEKRQNFRPFAFLTNGSDIFFWDIESETYRLVSGFFSPEDLENLLWLRQNRMPLNAVPLNIEIAGRPYQQEAIRRVAETFEEEKRRRALLVMATGTGKTRTTMGLIDLFIRANQARRVLFLADRDALVDQALTEGFKEHLPTEPRDRIYTYNIDRTKRLFVATLHTMGRCYQQFTPSFFDLIIFDEAHRSIFNRLGEVMNYFDARMIGLTATPARFVDRDTFRVFDCNDGKPTSLYDFDEAVSEKMLVNFSLYKARTGFQRTGIRGVDLTEEARNTLTEQGLDPDDIDYTGTQLEKTVSNRDTLRKQWEEIMEVCYKDESGQLPGKTIIFAMTQAHALRLAGVFEEMYPQYKGELVRVITHDTERVRDGSYGDGLISKFKKNSLPRIAISVDMLDTGINVPEITNLVFMKPVQSQIKLWQMIGRGTRNDEACKYKDRLPIPEKETKGRKTEFRIIDFWENDFDRQSDQTVSQSVPVLVTIFNTRLNILRQYLGKQDEDDCKQVIADLRAQIERIPIDSFAVKRVWPQIEEAWLDTFWRFLTPKNLEFLRLNVGPLMRHVPEVDVAAETFTSKIERLKYQMLTNAVKPETLESIVEDVKRLPQFVYEKETCKEPMELCLSSRLNNASPSELSNVIKTLAPQMKYRREESNTPLLLDLPDFIETRGFIIIQQGNEKVYVKEYRERVERRILELVETHPTMQIIRQGQPVTDSQLVELERTLRQELGSGEIELSTDNIRKAYGLKVGSLLGFLRYLLELDALPDYETVVRRNFEQHIARHRYNADQIRFLRVVQNVFLQKQRLQLADLYEEPLTAFGQNAVDRLFTQQDITELLELADQLAA